jgi:hypothetical protein
MTLPEKNLTERSYPWGYGLHWTTPGGGPGPFGFGRGGLLDSSFFGDSCFVLLN